MPHAHTPRLWLLRHPQPLVAAGVCYGQLDLPADPGHTFAASSQFAPHLSHIAAVRVSPLLRCQQLVHALDVSHPITDARLQEMHFGQWEGRSWADIGASAVDAWAQDLWHTAPGGGESLAHMMARVRQALVHSWQHDAQQGARDVLWVTHAGVIRCVQWLLRHGLAHASSADWQLPAPACGQWMDIPWQPHRAAISALA